MKTSINYKSDFQINEKAERIAMEVPFIFSYYVFDNRKYVVSFDGKEYVNCERKEDGSLDVFFNNHNLGIGPLKVERKFFINDEAFADGVFDVVTNDKTEIFLSSGSSEMYKVETVVIPPYLKGDKGEAMRWETMTEEEREELVQDVAEAIDPEMVMTENEQARIEAEKERQASEAQREESFTVLKGNMETTISEGETATKRANEAADVIETWESVVVTVEDEGEVSGVEPDVVNEAIRKTPQTLTKAEQTQARTNIGAASLEENAAFKKEVTESNEDFKTQTDAKLSEIGSKVYNLTFINISKWQTSLGDSLEDETWGYNPTTKKTYYKRNGELTSCEMDENILYKFGDDFYKWNGNDLIRYGIEYLINSIYNNEFLSWESAPSIKGMVASSGIAESDTSSYKVFKVKEGQNITFLGNASSNVFFVIVNSLSWFNTASYDFADGYSERVIINANSKKNITVPNGAKYIIVSHYYNDTDRTPQSLIIDDFDLIVGAKSYITNLNKSVSKLESDLSNSESVVKTKIVDLSDTLTMGYYNTNNGVGGVAQPMGSDTLGTVLVRIKQGDIIETNSEIDSDSVRQWCIMKDDLTITKILSKFSEYTVTVQDVLDGGTIMAIPCRVTEQVSPLYVRRTRNVVGRNEYDNKTIILLGDSQIGQCQGLEDVIEEKIGNRVINAGFGGCRWSWRTTSGTSDWDKFCAIGVADAIISGDFAPLYDAVDRLVESGSSVNYFKRALDGLSSLEFGNGENIILTIAYGGNDHSSSASLGGTDSTDKETLYGAMNYVIDSLVKAYPMMDIRVLCPTYVAYTYEKDESGRKVVTEDSDERKIGEYTRQEYAELLLEHAKRKKVPTYDMYNRGGRNKDNIYILTPDGIHPNTELGVKHTANRYLRVLDSF